MQIAFKIEGYNNFPPSKNALYWGKSAKWRWIKHFQNENKEKIQQLLNRLSEPDALVDVYITFYLTDEYFMKFEPQNYLDVLLDGLFGKHKDNRIKKLVVMKARGNKNWCYILIR